MARTVFHCTVTELEEKLGNDEFVEWLAYYRIEPWGEAFEDANHAWTRSVIVNVNRQKGQKAAKPKDFLLQRKAKEHKEMTTEELRSSFMRWAAATSNPMIKWEDKDGSRRS